MARGATSDDTALTLLGARHLADRDGDCDPGAFLADQAPAIRGLGPTTTAAIEQFRRGEPAGTQARATNGAAMRALPIGWILPHDQAERRRHVTITMSRATHADPAALVAACVIAACASWALEDASPFLLLAAAAGEARQAAQAVGTELRLAEMLTEVSAGTWEPPANGISLDPYETVCLMQKFALGKSPLRLLPVLPAPTAPASPEGLHSQPVLHNAQWQQCCGAPHGPPHCAARWY
jgi:ADP-ribosyl-[dinitrogen reductase] hydrolase